MRVLLSRFRCAAPSFPLLLLLLLLLNCDSRTQVRAQGSSQPERPRLYNIEGRVTLPDGRPASNVRVKLRGGLGINLEIVANDGGRFEFPELPTGRYQLEAISLSDSNLASDPTDIEANASRTATNSINVTIALREGRAATGMAKPGVISAVDAGQKVPSKARKAFEEGVKFRGSNKPDQALTSFSQAIEFYPDYYQALSQRADLYLNKRQFAEAAADFDHALKINPRYGSALRGVGYCKLIRGEFAEAAEYFGKAVTAEPGSARSFLLLGMANFELDRRDQAKSALQQALKLDVAQALRARLYLANIYAREQQYQQAVDELHAYLEAAPNDPDAPGLRNMEALWRTRLKE